MERERLTSRLIANPWAYDLLQTAFGVHFIRRKIAGHIGQPATLLDIAGGTGGMAGYVPASTLYLNIDLDREKLDGFRPTSPRASATQADATALPLGGKSFDVSIAVNMTHHLSDAQLSVLLHEIARVTRQRVVLLDPVWSRSPLSRLFWHYDRGSFPRQAETLSALLNSVFRCESTEDFRILHRYLLFVGSPA